MFLGPGPVQAVGVGLVVQLQVSAQAQSRSGPSGFVAAAARIAREVQESLSGDRRRQLGPNCPWECPVLFTSVVTVWLGL
jgi:hypothetical protein